MERGRKMGSEGQKDGGGGMEETERSYENQSQGRKETERDGRGAKRPDDGGGGVRWEGREEVLLLPWTLHHHRLCTLPLPGRVGLLLSVGPAGPVLSCRCGSQHPPLRGC